ncbi:MAG: CoA-transferase [Actinomycetota bacterium]|nr:CoA-transferase [Dehalococcoidia bacterium]MEC7909395.1 CoA-transferase [Actinomycetota bacterium]|tara:strand:+ start:1602 stop:2369 length:768 start_codon:yes stop_codon:yes gene_type:complete
MANDATIDEVCVTAIADSFRGDGEILCNPIGNIPVIAGRLAKATFEPAMVMTDTVSVLAANTIPIGEPNAEKLVEAWMPYRDLFDIVWSGRRHIVMGASQIDPHGNQNFAAIGDWKKPKAQLLGLRGAPGNLVNNTTSYWIPNHSTRSFVQKVDIVSGPGYDRVSKLSNEIQQNHEIRKVVSNLGVFNFSNSEKRMQLVSNHPDVTVEEIIAATGFELLVPDKIEETRMPTKEELKLIREVIDPHGLRKSEFVKK